MTEINELMDEWTDELDELDGRDDDFKMKVDGRVGRNGRTSYEMEDWTDQMTELDLRD